MEDNLTQYEKQFHSLLKRQFFLMPVQIRNKVAINELCNERKDMVILFGKDIDLVKDVVIDFVLYKNDKAFAGIDIIDEPEELTMCKGEQLLIDTIFRRMGYEFFRIVDVNKLNEAAKLVKKKTTQIINKI